jgi:hypothetical protein
MFIFSNFSHCIYFIAKINTSPFPLLALSCWESTSTQSANVVFAPQCVDARREVRDDYRPVLPHQKESKSCLLAKIGVDFLLTGGRSVQCRNVGRLVEFHQVNSSPA